MALNPPVLELRGNSTLDQALAMSTATCQDVNGYADSSSRTCTDWAQLRIGVAASLSLPLSAPLPSF